MKDKAGIQILGIQESQVKTYTISFNGKVYKIKRKGDWMSYKETITDVESGKKISEDTDMDFLSVLRPAFFMASNGSTF